ncbi:MAG: 3-oxoacyl-ACP reductase FabG [Chloroflexi bacterium]|nr:3-oxoacyl-ACP reductase FabG [Chloroflexota bacterium]
MRLSERVAIVTGGGTGLGRAVALRCAAEGATVVVAGRRAEPLGQVVREIEAQGGRALAAPTDVTAGADVDRLVGRALEQFGRVDSLVNAAGVLTLRAPLGAVPEADWTQMLDVNLTGVYHCCKAALPALSTARGCIVNFGSVSGMKGVPVNAAYGAAKAGVIQLTKCLAVDYAAAGVRVNVVCPGFVETDMNRHLFAELRTSGQIAALEARHPLGLIGTPDDIANAVLFLLSDEARWITGVVLPVDGGMAAT